MNSNAQLRQQLGERLRVDADFDAFCHDCFPAVFRRYSVGMERTTKTTLLLQVIGMPEQIRSELDKWSHRLNEPKQRHAVRSTACIALLLIIASVSSLIYKRMTQRYAPPQAAANTSRQKNSFV